VLREIGVNRQTTDGWMNRHCNNGRPDGPQNNAVCSLLLTEALKSNGLKHKTCWNQLSVRQTVLFHK